MDRYGRLIFEHRNSLGMTVTLGILAGGVVWGGASLDLPSVAFASGVIGVAFVGLAAANAFGRIQCFESGLLRRSLFSRRELAYEDLSAFSYGEVAVELEGIHTRTNVSLEFHPLAGSRVRFLAVFPPGKERNIAPLRELRERVSGFVAERLGRRMAEDGAVDWTPGVRLLPHGIEFEARGKGSSTTLLRFDGLQCRFAQGSLLLAPPGAAQAALTIDAGESNFFPGLRLLEAHVPVPGQPGEQP